MRHCALILFTCLTSLLAAQKSFNGIKLTQAEMDSFRTGKASPALIAKIDQNFKAEQAQRDSFIQKRILNQPIPDFDARDTSGLVHRPSMYRGRVWIVYFWDFWENSFQYEIPSLNNLVDSLRGQGVEIVSFLNYDLGESEKKYMADKSIHFPIVENSEKFGNEFLGTHFYRPFICIIDKKGVCRYFYDGKNLRKGYKFEHRNELLEGNKNELPTYDFIEKVKFLLQE